MIIRTALNFVLGMGRTSPCVSAWKNTRGIDTGKGVARPPGRKI